MCVWNEKSVCVWSVCGLDNVCLCVELKCVKTEQCENKFMLVKT